MSPSVLRQTSRARRCRILAIVVLWLGVVPGAAAGKDIRTVVTFKYTGSASQSANGLGFLGKGTVTGQWGTEDEVVRWTMGVRVPVIIDNFGNGRERFAAVRGDAHAYLFEASGTINTDPEAGCEFGSECPKPGDPTYEQPCEEHLFAVDEWAQGVGAGGHPEAAIDNGRLVVDLRTPASYDATSSSDSPLCQANPTSTTDIGLHVFNPPVAFNGNPPPPVNVRKLMEYHEALAPTLTLRLTGNKWRLLSNDQFNVNWHWTARFAPPGESQVGPDISDFLDLRSQIAEIDVRGL